MIRNKKMEQIIPCSIFFYVF